MGLARLDRLPPAICGVAAKISRRRPTATESTAITAKACTRGFMNTGTDAVSSR
jgi:hypothetical protein